MHTLSHTLSHNEDSRISECRADIQSQCMKYFGRHYQYIQKTSVTCTEKNSLMSSTILSTLPQKETREDFKSVECCIQLFQPPPVCKL